jgi:hypothetical protein
MTAEPGRRRLKLVYEGRKWVIVFYVLSTTASLGHRKLNNIRRGPRKLFGSS